MDPYLAALIGIVGALAGTQLSAINARRLAQESRGGERKRWQVEKQTEAISSIALDLLEYLSCEQQRWHVKNNPAQSDVSLGDVERGLRAARRNARYRALQFRAFSPDVELHESISTLTRQISNISDAETADDLARRANTLRVGIENLIDSFRTRSII